jgi:serine/threonine protein kinase
MKSVKTRTRYFFEFSNDIWKNISGEAKELILWMTTDNPEERPTADDALRHPWFDTQQKNVLDTLGSISEEYSFTDADTAGNFCEAKINSMSPKFMRDLMYSNKYSKEVNECKIKPQAQSSTAHTMTNSEHNT